MIVYRAEHIDGGGPFYYLNGQPRDKNLPEFKNNNNLYGADSIESLTKLITGYGFDIKNYIIKEYNNVKIINYNKNNGHIIFKKEEENEI